MGGCTLVQVVYRAYRQHKLLLLWAACRLGLHASCLEKIILLGFVCHQPYSCAELELGYGRAGGDSQRQGEKVPRGLF